MNLPVLQQQIDFDVGDLVRAHPPVWKHPHKEAIYDRICQEGAFFSGTIRYTRWAMSPPSSSVELHFCDIQGKKGFYDYPLSTPGCWHVNFADPRLFAAYGSRLMAQDEWQVLEHPVLGSLREALLHAGHPALTRENGRSTPVAISNVPRVCSLDLTDSPPDSKKTAWWSRIKKRPLNPASLYGNEFAAASKEKILQAITLLKPPSYSNIIAIAAPTGLGRYSQSQILDILQTAFNGFAAAVMESQRAGLKTDQVQIHTGWWGCGAFGGNRVLMAMIQVLAARMAGAGKLCFYIGDECNRFDLEEGLAHLENLSAGAGRDIDAIVDEIEALGFRWGKSDGN